METVIESRHITHYYGRKLVYEDLNFSVPRGRVLGLLGKNGTGKTTIINILNGYLQPTSGECFVLGESMRSLSPTTRARIGLLLEGHVQYSYFTVEEIERFYRHFYPGWQAEAYYELMEKLRVARDHRINRMSRGQRSQVALGLLFAQNPEVLILDDFSMGLDPGYRRLFAQHIREWAKAGDKTIFITSHIIQDMELLVDDCLILDYGRILLHRPTAEILSEFRRYRIPLPERAPLPQDPEIWQPERIGETLEFYSFLPSDAMHATLARHGVAPQEPLSPETLSLEDCFIGMTGKY